MSMDYNYTSPAFQQAPGRSHEQPAVQQHLGYQGHYINHAFPQAPVADCPREQAQGHAVIQPQPTTYGMNGSTLNNGYQANTPPSQFTSAYTGFDKGYGFAPPGVLLTPQGSENASSPLTYGDVPMQSTARTNQGSQNATDNHNFPRQAGGAGNGVVNTASQGQPPQLRHSASSVSIGDSNQQRYMDDANNSNGQMEKSASSGEDKDDTLQGKRKAQNRAAQRAFRERKERRVRDLEQELADYKQKLNSIMESNELLKQQIAKVSTENEILKATSEHHRRRSRHRRHHHSSQRSTSSSSGSGDDGRSQQRRLSKEPMETGPMRYSPMDYAPAKATHRTFVCPQTGEKLLTAGATWDLIVQTLEQRGLDLDVQGIYEKLRLHTRCDGQGPVIQESKVKEAIEQSTLEGQDEIML